MGGLKNITYVAPLKPVLAGCVLVILAACASTQTIGKKDFSHGINVEVLATEAMPAYHITSDVGLSDSGHYYVLLRRLGEWFVRLDSPRLENLVSKADGEVLVSDKAEILWTDGKLVAPYFGSKKYQLSETDGTFRCPRRGEGHRACRSKFTKPIRTYDQLPVETGQLLYEYDFSEIIKAVNDTNILHPQKLNRSGG